MNSDMRAIKTQFDQFRKAHPGLSGKGLRYPKELQTMLGRVKSEGATLKEISDASGLSEGGLTKMLARLKAEATPASTAKNLQAKVRTQTLPVVTSVAPEKSSTKSLSLKLPQTKASKQPVVSSIPLKTANKAKVLKVLKVSKAEILSPAPKTNTKAIKASEKAPKAKVLSIAALPAAKKAKASVPAKAQQAHAPVQVAAAPKKRGRPPKNPQALAAPAPVAVKPAAKSKAKGPAKAVKAPKAVKAVKAVKAPKATKAKRIDQPRAAASLKKSPGKSHGIALTGVTADGREVNITVDPREMLKIFYALPRP